MELFLITLIGLSIILIISGLFNHIRVKSYLNKNLVVEPHILKNVKDKIGVEATTAVAITIFDVLYNTSKIDPFVLKGIDHLHHSHNFESLGDLSTFLKENIIKSEEGSTAWRQMIHKYKGYTGEEYSFDKLDQKGIDYQKPESGTNDQYDAIIDGQKVDFAITDDPRYIADKLEDPEIIVYTNREMAAAYGDNPRVIVDEDLSVKEMFEKTDETFTGIDDLGDFIDGIPLVTTIISGIKNTKGVIDGKKNIGTAIEHTATDVVSIGVGGWAGAKIGMAIGLSLAPITGGTSVVIAPIIGSLLGALSGKGIGNWFKERHLREAKEVLEATAGDFKRKFFQRYPYLLKKVEDIFLRNKNRSEFAYKESQSWFGRIFFPKIMTKFYSLASKKFLEELKKNKVFYEELRKKLELSSELDGGILLYAQGPSILAGDYQLLGIYYNMDKAIKDVEKEIKKLS